MRRARARRSCPFDYAPAAIPPLDPPHRERRASDWDGPSPGSSAGFCAARRRRQFRCPTPVAATAIVRMGNAIGDEMRSEATALIRRTRSCRSKRVAQEECERRAAREAPPRAGGPMGDVAWRDGRCAGRHTKFAQSASQAPGLRAAAAWRGVQNRHAARPRQIVNRKHDLASWRACGLWHHNVRRASCLCRRVRARVKLDNEAITGRDSGVPGW